MEVNTEVLIGLALFVASELIGMSRLKSNSLLQLILMAALRAFPYESKRRTPPNPLDSLLGRKDRR
jgi:hypothetical protein